MIDILVTSSCRKVIKKTIRSFLEKIKYSGKFRFLVHIDVLDPSNLPVIKKYIEDFRSIDKIDFDIHVNFNPSKDFCMAHTNAVNYLFKKIETPYYFQLEDDWKFLKSIEIDPLIEIMDKYHNIEQIRLSKEKIKEKTWLYHLSEVVSEEFLIPNTEVLIDNIPLVETPVWSFNPHLGRSSGVKSFSDMPLDCNPEKYICSKYIELPDKGKIYILGKIGESAYVMDIGRNRIRQKLRKYKYIIKGGKYPEYLFGE